MFLLTNFKENPISGPKMFNNIFGSRPVNSTWKIPVTAGVVYTLVSDAEKSILFEISIPYSIIFMLPRDWISPFNTAEVEVISAAAASRTLSLGKVSGFSVQAAPAISMKQNIAETDLWHNLVVDKLKILF